MATDGVMGKKSVNVSTTIPSTDVSNVKRLNVRLLSDNNDHTDKQDVQHPDKRTNIEDSVCLPILPTDTNNKMPPLAPDELMTPRFRIEKGVMIVGDCPTSAGELELLCLPPGYQLLESMNDEKIEQELAMFATKFRWEKKK